MKSTADIIFRDEKFLVTGDLDFTNVVSVYRKSLQHLGGAGELVFDFSQLKSSNSAGLALVLEWMKYARKRQKNIRFESISSDLMAIAKAAGIDNMIPVANGLGLINS